MVLQQPARLTIPWEPTVACCTPGALHWAPEWKNNMDPSGRAAWGVHNSANKKLVTADVVEPEKANAQNGVSTNGVNGVNGVIAH